MARTVEFSGESTISVCLSGILLDVLGIQTSTCPHVDMNFINFKPLHHTVIAVCGCAVFFEPGSWSTLQLFISCKCLWFTVKLRQTSAYKSIFTTSTPLKY